MNEFDSKIHAARDHSDFILTVHGVKVEPAGYAPPVPAVDIKARHNPRPMSREDAIIRRLISHGFGTGEITIALDPEMSEIQICGVSFTLDEIRNSDAKYIINELIANGVKPSGKPPETDTATCRTGNWTQTRNKRKFDYVNLDPDSIDIEDIAWALSHTNRFTGHTSIPYSVGEHSVRCAMELHDWPAILQLEALLHDASEAYLSDIARPAKYLPELAGYLVVEKRIQDAIQAKYGIAPGHRAVVKHIDDVMLATEARDLMSPMLPGWGLTKAPLEGVIEPWSADLTRYRFLSLFYRLADKAARPIS